MQSIFICHPKGIFAVIDAVIASNGKDSYQARLIRRGGRDDKE